MTWWETWDDMVGDSGWQVWESGMAGWGDDGLRGNGGFRHASECGETVEGVRDGRCGRAGWPVGVTMGCAGTAVLGPHQSAGRRWRGCGMTGVGVRDGRCGGAGSRVRVGTGFPRHDDGGTGRRGWVRWRGARDDILGAG